MERAKKTLVAFYLSVLHKVSLLRKSLLKKKISGSANGDRPESLRLPDPGKNWFVNNDLAVSKISQVCRDLAAHSDCVRSGLAGCYSER